MSWTVVIGAVSALVYTGLKPLLKEFGMPQVDPASVRGAMIAPPPQESPAPVTPDPEATPVLSAEEAPPPVCEPGEETACGSQSTL